MVRTYLKAGFLFTMPTKQFNQLFHETHSWKKLTVIPNVTVGPDLASDILQLNISNRPIKEATLKKYVKEMKEEKWLFQGDTIKISKSGKLLDGQHRLLAISNSGFPQVFNIQTGLEDNSFEVMDTGKARTAGDVLAIKGLKYHNTISSAIRLVMIYDSLFLTKERYWPERFQASNKKISEWCDTHDIELMQHCAIQGSKLQGKSRILNHSVYAAFYYIFSRKNRDDAALFFSMLASGEDISSTKNPSIYLLRQKLINMLNSRLRLRDVSEKFALLIKAWNFFRSQKDIKQLTYQPDKEEFPKAI